MLDSYSISVDMRATGCRIKELRESKKLKVTELAEIMHDFLNDIPETRTSCGFRENMLQEANKPSDAVALGWLVCGIFESLIQKCMTS